ncbi:MAG TPA: hypothetical protein VJ020_02250 [Anaerolineales bacterium]|nr:hypothetical protein [Anaerolineales bacterium]
MKPPAWTSANHPVARRELKQWFKHRRSLRWLWLLFILPPLCGPASLVTTLLAVYNLSAPIEDIPPEALGFSISGAFVLGLWGLQAFLGWGVGLFAAIGTATTVAHERETLNWPLLRITTLSTAEIVLAKITALLRWLSPPVLFLAGLRILTVVGTLAFIYLWNKDIFNLPKDSWGSLTAITIFFLPICVATTFTDLVYNASIGLFSSTLLRTSAGSLAVGFGALGLLWMFVFLPAQRFSYLWIDELMRPRSYAPYWDFLPLILAVYVVPAILQIGLSFIAFGATLERTRRLFE